MTSNSLSTSADLQPRGLFRGRRAPTTRGGANPHSDARPACANGVVFPRGAGPRRGAPHRRTALEFWQGLFAAHGYTPFDPVRPGFQLTASLSLRIATTSYSTCRGSAGGGHTQLRAFQIPDDRPVPERASLSWQLRCGVIRQLPRPAVEALAATKHAVVRARRRQYP